MFHQIKKYFALKAYIKKLGPLLISRYGKHKNYTTSQIQKTIEVSGLNEKFRFYAYALYCLPSEFEKESKEEDQNLNYDSLRQELGNKFFRKEDDFVFSDVINRGNEIGLTSLGDGSSSGMGVSGDGSCSISGDCGGGDGS